MSTTESTRARRARVLLAALAWTFVASTVLHVPSGYTLQGVNSAIGVITAATSASALLFLGVLRLPRLHKHADVPRGVEIELLASWTYYRKEIFRLALYPTLAGYLLLWAFDDVVVPFVVCVILLYIGTAQAVQSLRRTGCRGFHHPVLGVVIGGLFTASASLLGLSTMALTTFPTWQVVIPCAIAGVGTFAATLITLWAVPAAKN